MDRRNFTKLASGLAGGLFFPSIALATQKLPKVIKIIVPFSPGGSNDVFARALADQLGQDLKISVIIENRPGAGGSMGSAAAAQARPDGATLLLTSNSIVTNNAVMAKPAFDPVDSFKHISILNKGPSLIIVNGKSPYNELTEFITAIKEEKINQYASAGIGSSAHLASEMLNHGLNSDLLHVPYKGISNAAIDIGGDLIDMVITTSASVSGQIKTGILKPIGVTSLEPSPFFKDLTPLSKHIPGYDIEAWWGIFAPNDTPQWIAELLNEKITEIAFKEKMLNLFENEATVPVAMQLDEIKEFVRVERDKYIEIARNRNIKPI